MIEFFLGEGFVVTAFIAMCVGGLIGLCAMDKPPEINRLPEEK